MDDFQKGVIQILKELTEAVDDLHSDPLFNNTDWIREHILDLEAYASGRQEPKK